MFDHFVRTVVVLLAALVASGAGTAEAACNAIPDAQVIAALAPNPSSTLKQLRSEMAALGEVARYKGALGRIASPYLFVDSENPLRVHADGQCVGGSRKRRLKKKDTPNPGRLFAAFLLESDAGAKVNVLTIGSEDFCDLINEASHTDSEDGRLGDVECRVAHIEVSDATSGFDVDIPLAPLAAYESEQATDGDTPGASVAILVGLAPESRAKFLGLSSRIAAKGCASTCSAVRDADGFACIDTLYTLRVGGTYASDPVPCTVQLPPKFKKKKLNDFKKNCDKNPFGPSGLVGCDQTEDVLFVWQDKCGAVHIPLLWDSILRSDTNKPIDARKVAGRTGAGRAVKGGGHRVWIPGREFVGSTPYGDPGGTLPGIDWRAPDVEVWYPNEPSQAFGLRGVVDEEDSIVHLYPRMATSVLCNTAGKEACMSVTGRYVGEGIECACTDRYTAGCDCVTGAVAEYFQCTGSTAVAGMPCTRHAHCNPGGLCDGTPRCLKPGTVWEPGGSPPYISSTCRTDDDCANEPDGRTQCGYRLFNLGDRKETFSRIIKLDRKVVPNAPRVRRGFCSNVTYKTCTSKGPPQLYNMCLGGQGECRGYWLEAGEQVTKP